MASITKKRGTDLSDLTRGNLFFQILFYTIPIILNGILVRLFNTADTLMVGRYGGTVDECETALAAVGSCGTLITLLSGLFMGISIGSTVSMARDIGRKSKEDANKTLHTSLLLALIFGLILVPIGFLFGRPMLVLMGTKPELLDEAMLYMRAIFIGMPFNIVYFFAAAVLRSTGDTVRPLIFLLAGGGTNVLLNYIMVAVFHTGALGVGVATAASNIVTFILILLFMLRTEGPCHLSFRDLKIDRAKLRIILFIGVPSGIESSLFSISNVCLASGVNYFDKSVVAANTTASNIDSYLYCIGDSFKQATITFIGQNLAVKDLSRIKKTMLYAGGISLSLSLIASLFVYAFSTPLLSFFAPGNTAILEPGRLRLLWVGCFYILCALQEMGLGFLRGTGRSIVSLPFSLVSVIGFRIFWVFAIFPLSRTLTTLYLCYPISWGITSLAFLFVSLWIYQKIKKRD